MPSLDDDEWNTGLKPLSMVLKVAQIQSTILINSYGYNDVARMIKIGGGADSDTEEDDDADSDCDERELMVANDDPLAKVLVDSLAEMETTSRLGGNEIEISPGASVAALFQPRSKEAKALKPRLLLTFDLDDPDAKCVGCLSGCRFIRSEDMLTERFTSQYLAQHKLPRHITTSFFIDVISARKKPAGQLMLLSAYLYAVRVKYPCLAMVAVTSKGVQAGKNFGMESHTYREDGAQRTLMWIQIGDLDLKHLNRKLRIGSANNKTLQDLCTRFGLSSRTSHKIITRC